MYLFVIQTTEWQSLFKYLQSQIPVVEIKPNNLSHLERYRGKLMLMQDEEQDIVFDDTEVHVVKMQIYIGTISDPFYDLSIPSTASYDHIMCTMITYLIRKFNIEAVINLNTNIPDLALSLVQMLNELSYHDSDLDGFDPMVGLFPEDPHSWNLKELEALENDNKDVVQRQFTQEVYEFLIASLSPMKVIITSLGFDFRLDVNYPIFVYSYKRTVSEPSMSDVCTFLALLITRFL